MGSVNGEFQMTLMSQIGEKGYLKDLLPQLSQAQRFVNGFGHDASIVDFGLDELIAFKIDRAPTPVSLTRGWSDYRVWGRLAVAANISDLLAVGAKPRALMLSVVVPRDFDSASVTDIVLGCQESCEQHGVAFVGGDTKEGDAIQVVGAAIGSVDKHYFLGRRQAQPGDHLVIAGQLGGFAGAMSILETNSKEPLPRQQLLEMLTMPTAKVQEGAYLRAARLATAACDLSDGLTDALDVFCGTGVGLTIDASALPLHAYALQAAQSLSVDPAFFAFAVGDWAIACVVPHASIGELLAGAPSTVHLYDVGRFDSSGVRKLRREGGATYAMPCLVNEHFRTRLEDDSSYVERLVSSAVYKGAV
jgi:thiamine-monophosphate kinase